MKNEIPFGCNAQQVAEHLDQSARARIVNDPAMQTATLRDEIREWASSFRPFRCVPDTAELFERDREEAHQMVVDLLSLIDSQAETILGSGGAETMSFDKKDDELIRVVLRPVRGCATDSQYSDAYDRLTTAITTVRQEAGVTALRNAIQIVDTAPGCHSAGKWYIDPVALVQRLNAALEAAANSVKDSEPEGEDRATSKESR